MISTFLLATAICRAVLLSQSFQFTISSPANTFAVSTRLSEAALPSMFRPERKKLPHDAHVPLGRSQMQPRESSSPASSGFRRTRSVTKLRWPSTAAVWRGVSETQETMEYEWVFFKDL